MIHEALVKVKHVIKGAIKIMAPLTYRQRYQRSTGRDPLRCPHCHSDMGVWRIWHPTYGVIHDELDTTCPWTFRVRMWWDLRSAAIPSPYSFVPLWELPRIIRQRFCRDQASLPTLSVRWQTRSIFTSP